MTPDILEPKLRQAAIMPIVQPRSVDFVLSLVALSKGVQKQFFPDSERPELLVDLWLPQGASLKATEAQAASRGSRRRIMMRLR